MRSLSGSKPRGLRWLTVGGLATAAMVALLLAPAFACTGQGGVGPLKIFPDKGPPGTRVTVEMTFRPDPGSPGDVVVAWGPESDRRALATVTPDAVEGTARVEVVVPSDAVAAYYPITAFQMRVDGTARAAAQTFRVLGTRSPAGPPAPNHVPGPLQPVPAVLSPVQGAPATGGPGTPAGVAAPSVRQPAGASPSSGPATDPTGTALPTVVAPGVVPTEGGPVPADPVRAGQAQPAFSSGGGQDPNAMIGLPSPTDLWSGLTADQTPSLLDSPAARQDQRTPAGSILLGSGAALLGGLALLTGRRRLALSARR